MNKIKLQYKDKEYEVSPLTTPSEFIKEFNLKVNDPVCALLNGRFAQLSKRIPVDTRIDILERASYQGQKIYESSLLFLFVSAFRKRFPQLDVFIQHSIQQGIYAEVRQGELDTKAVEDLEELMQDMVKKDLPIEISDRERDVALQRMREDDRGDLISLYQYLFSNEVLMYDLDGVTDCLYLPLLPSTKLIEHFKLEKYQDGVAILMPDFEKATKIQHFQHNEKLFNTFGEYNNWSRILKARTVGQLNSYIMEDKISEYIKYAEALHEKKLVEIADTITGGDYIPRIVLIAGPSSSGKTTFSKRLGVQLSVNGFKPVTIGLDDYFVDREKTPLDENGNYDFESLEAIDYKLFQQHVSDLLAGKEIELPKFDFVSGKSSPSGHFMKLKDNQILIAEGIHGNNPKLTESIERKDKFRVYIAPMTQLNLHRHDRVPASDTRLIRRIVRDSLFRGYTANDTLKQWKSVRAGETKNIFPYQEDADVMFNSALFYELSVLKLHAERQLLKVQSDHPMYSEAQRLLRFLSFFLPLQTDDVPKNSIVKEFIGGSSFRY